jgi:hypothetical protein
MAWLQIGTSVVARRLNEPTPNETFGLVIKVRVWTRSPPLLATTCD